ncbi:MAG: hypothetical protein O3C34_00225 [Proteobacteria bacterium]|nr:hypothetical protein [Pseudomonadota bacterium]
MKRTAIYIATTEGPSEIQRITPEDSDVRSVVCHDGKAIELPISADYDSFVRRPTGVIEACFGHSAYRVDISNPIASGLSWQLGLFIAHALFEEGRLVRSDDKTPQIVWATGEVTRDLTVDTVEDVDRKIRQSEGRIRAHLDAGARVVMAVPAGNLIEATQALEDVFAGDCDRLHIVAAQTVCDVLAVLGLKRRRRIRQWLARTPSMIGGHRKMPRHLAYAASCVLLAITVLAGWQKLGLEPDLGVAKAQAVRLVPASLRPHPASTLAAISVATQAPADAPCAAVHLDRVAPLITRQPVIEGAPAAGLRVAGLCDFHYRLTNGSDRAATLWVMALRENANGAGFRLRTIYAEKTLAPRATIDLDARPPSRLIAPLRQDLVVLSVQAGVVADFAGLGGVWRRARNAASAQDVDRILAEARGHGVAVLRLTNDFRP